MGLNLGMDTWEYRDTYNTARCVESWKPDNNVEMECSQPHITHTVLCSLAFLKARVNFLRRQKPKLRQLTNKQKKKTKTKI